MAIPLVTLFAVLACVVLLALLVMRQPRGSDLTPLLARFDAFNTSARSAIADEMMRIRNEARGAAAELRGEVANAIRSGDESAMVKIAALTSSVSESMRQLSDATDARMLSLNATVAHSAESLQQSLAGRHDQMRTDVAAAIRSGDESAMLKITALTSSTANSLNKLTEVIDTRIVGLNTNVTRSLESLQQSLAAKHDQMRNEAAENRRSHREEIAKSLQTFNATVVSSVAQHGSTQREDLERVRLQIEKLSEANELRLENVRKSVDERLQVIQNTVDEKLQDTLEKRLGESFTRVAAQLEEVHKGLGEMRGLATGVSDLKKVFSNVKTRGGWGEVQLESLLEQMLSPEQYERNVSTKEGTREAVEFAVKFPGKGETPLLLPLDAKFPIEDYQHLIDAHERGDVEAIDIAGRRLETTVRNSAKTIRDKYVNPPVTTDFAIMFLPTEGLYAEVLRRPGLAEQLQRECGVLIAGPTTLTAILSSLQMGFRTLAIEKRSSEVWRLLEAVKTEFGRFGDVVDKVNKNLDFARTHMEKLGVRTRAVTRKLKDVESLPESDAKLLLKLGPIMGEADDDEDEDGWVEREANGANANAHR